MLLLSDFSKTLTAPTSKTTWSLCRESGLFPESYSAERDRLFEEYRPFELAGDNDKVREWFGKHLDLMNEYGVVSKLPDTIVRSIETEYLLPREGLEEFVEHVKAQDIVVRIVSSGISELVQRFLSPHGLKLPIGFKEQSSGICANDLLMHDGVRSVLTPADKLSNAHSFLEGFDKIVVLGDAPEDFAIPGLATYTPNGKFRGFSFSDDEIYPGVAWLGKNASLAEIVARIK
jgi:hypothetical protein